MANMLGKKITINVPQVDLVTFDHVSDFVGGPEQVLACVLEVLGDLPGTVLVMFDGPAANRLLTNLNIGEKADYLNLTPLQESALKEIGNILAGSYLSDPGILPTSAFSPACPIWR